MEAFVYIWKNITNGFEYIGYHKGDENDGYVSSSQNDLFWRDYELGLLNRTIVFRGTSEECIEKESNMLRQRGFDNLYNRNINGKIIMTEDVKQKISDGLKGKPKSEAHKKAIGNALRGREGTFKGKCHSAETIEKMRNVKRTEEHKQAIGNALRGREGTFKGKSHVKIECPHCHKHIAKNVYGRWHGDNCKEKADG